MPTSRLKILNLAFSGGPPVVTPNKPQEGDTVTFIDRKEDKTVYSYSRHHQLQRQPTVRASRTSSCSAMDKPGRRCSLLRTIGMR